MAFSPMLTFIEFDCLKRPMKIRSKWNELQNNKETANKINEKLFSNLQIRKLRINCTLFDKFCSCLVDATIDNQINARFLSVFSQYSELDNQWAL